MCSTITEDLKVNLKGCEEYPKGNEKFYYNPNNNNVYDEYGNYLGQGKVYFNSVFIKT